jgi:hypothetical protein
LLANAQPDLPLKPLRETAALSVVIATTPGPGSSPDVAHSTILFKDLVRVLAPDAPIPEDVK